MNQNPMGNQSRKRGGGLRLLVVGVLLVYGAYYYLPNLTVDHYTGEQVLIDKTLDAAQESAARDGIARAQPDWPTPIVTTVEALSEWYPAEDYHQSYWDGEGQRNPYCLAVIPPKIAKLRKRFGDRLRKDQRAP